METFSLLQCIVLSCVIQMDLLKLISYLQDLDKF